MPSDKGQEFGRTTFGNWLAGRMTAVRRQIQSAAVSESRWSVARLAAFVLPVTIWYPLRSDSIAALLAVLVGIAIFAWTIHRHRLARTGHATLKLHALIAEESSRRLTTPVTTIRSAVRPADVPAPRQHAGHILASGRTWPLTDQERDDLDFYSSPVGLFGILNRTSTQAGAACLRDYLENLCLEPQRIRARQEAVRWLAEHHEQRLNLLGRLAGLRNLDAQWLTFEASVGSAGRLMSHVASWALRLWSLASLTAAIGLLGGVMADDLKAALALTGLAGVNILIWLPFWSKVRRRLVQWQQADGFIREYYKAAAQAGSDLPAETDLNELREPLATIDRNDVLAGIIRWLNWASGGFVQVLMDLFVFYDIHILEGIQRHALPYRKQLTVGLSAIAELEAILSLACFAAEQPDCSWPEPVGGMQLSIERGRHILIDPACAIASSVHLSHQPNLWIITGSNMSGKSTFLRMAGMNVVLAQTGCVVLADRMTWSPMRLITDLRVRDNLSKGESYFLAEVRQLRRMIVPPTGAEPVLGLADEPFRGTNYREQHAATLAIVESLTGAAGLFLVATHDATVTRIADGVHAQNHHFQEQLGQAELLFDYQLRPGPASTCNAIRVMQRENYPEGLVRRALDHAESYQREETR